MCFSWIAFRCGAQHIRDCRPRTCAQQCCSRVGTAKGCQVNQWVTTAGAIQSVTLSGCNSARVVGYVRVPVYSAPEAMITLSLLNGTVASPCGGVYGEGRASQAVQIRQVCLLGLHYTRRGRSPKRLQTCTQMPESRLLPPALL